MSETATSVHLACQYKSDVASEPDLKEWFPVKTRSEHYSDALAKKVLDKLAISLSRKGATMKRTPAGAGMSLLEHMLPENEQYVSLSASVQETIRHEMTQHYVKFFPPTSPISEVIQYDARLAYMSKCHFVPCGLASIEQSSEYAGYRLGFYKARVTVPDGWQHIGLVPRRPRQYQMYWDYPNTPGESWETWLDGAEIALLQNNGIMPWPCEISERILFREGESKTNDPLGKWIDLLSEATLKMNGQADEEHRLMRQALRAMALYTIGSCHSADKKSVTISDGQPVPSTVPSFATPVRIEHGWEYRWAIPHTGLAARWDHPEWSAHIWAKWRCQCIRTALKVPFGELVYIHTDALYTTKEQEIKDTSKAGGFRIKDRQQFAKPIKPRSIRQLMEVLHHA